MEKQRSAQDFGIPDANNFQHGFARGISRNALSDRKQLQKSLLLTDAPDPLTSSVEQGIGNDSGTIRGRKVNHADPLDIPPRGMKRSY